MSEQGIEPTKELGQAIADLESAICRKVDHKQLLRYLERVRVHYDMALLEHHPFWTTYDDLPSGR